MEIIIGILEKVDRKSLVILDELGAGTDPQEGAALARSLMSNLLDRGITTLVTTHHPDLKVYAHSTPGVINASVEFDLESFFDFYKVINAKALSERIGMNQSLLAQYIKGIKKPSPAQTKRILHGVQQIGRELTEVRFLL